MKLRRSSRNEGSSTRISGSWNWISRSLNGSSLKRPLRVDRLSSDAETSSTNQSGGHPARRRRQNATRDGKHQGLLRKYSRSHSSLIILGVNRKYCGFHVGITSLSVAPLCCPGRNNCCTGPGRPIERVAGNSGRREPSRGSGSRFARPRRRTATGGSGCSRTRSRHAR